MRGWHGVEQKLRHMTEVNHFGSSPAHDAYLCQRGLGRLDWRNAALSGFARLTRLSLQFFGEHCTECAAPDCHASCSLFKRTAVGRCRRFGDGIVVRRCARSETPFEMEVLFLPASRLFAVGNTFCLSKRAYRIWLPVALVVSRLMYLLQAAWRFLPTRVHWAVADVIRGVGNRIPRLLNFLGARSGLQPDSLVAAIGNPQTEDVAVELSVSGFDPSSAGRSFRRTLILGHGWHYVRVPIEEIRSAIDIRRLHRICLTPLIERPRLLQIPYVGYAIGSDPVTGMAAGRGGRPGKIKLLVVDLDETLWNGIAVEAPDQIKELRPGVREVLNELDRRGILLSIASKNNAEDAMGILDRLGIRELFLHPQIGWEPKSAGLRTIVAKLNIGMDAVAFADDSAFERAEVRAALPLVRVYDGARLTEIVTMEEFDVPITQESQMRRRLYREEESRAEAMIVTGMDYNQFLAWCGMRVVIKSYGPDNAERVSELVQRTNQLNFSGNRYTRESLERIIAAADVLPLVVSCSDRFGSYGIVGFALLRASGSVLSVEDLMLSCRVQGKQVESRFLRHVGATAAEAGFDRCECRFRPTTRNAPAATALDALDVVCGRIDGPDGVRKYMLSGAGEAASLVEDETDLLARLAHVRRTERDDGAMDRR